MPANHCNICGGWARQLPPHGAHWLCYELKKRGLPTPNMGEMCPECSGAGTKGTGGVMLSFDLGPAAIKRSIDAQFTPCPMCGGKGTIPAEASHAN